MELGCSLWPFGKITYFDVAIEISQEYNCAQPVFVKKKYI